MTKHVEQRATKEPVKIEARDGGRSVLSGYAAVFYSAADPGSEYALWDDLVERILPGAFDRALKERQDVRCLYNHEPDNLLGRTSAGTLRLKVDARGLAYDNDLPDTTVGKDVGVLLSRGDMSGSSFSFMPTRASWIEEQRNGRTVWIRQIEDCDIFDVGPVTYPAYTSATAGVRSKSEAITAERDAWLAQRAAVGDAADEVALALALVDEDELPY